MRGHVYQRGKTWTYVAHLGYDPVTGKRKQKTKGGFKKKKEAEDALTKILAEINEGSYIEPSKETMEDFFQTWLEGKKLTIKESTYVSHRGIVCNHIIPNLGKIKLAALKTGHIQKLYNQLADTFKPLTVRRIHQVLNTALGDAVRQGYMKQNPAQHTHIPKAVHAEIQTWTEEHIQSFWDISRHSRYHMAFVLAATTGMRKGEILGLRWQDIDFEGKRLSIRQTLSAQNKLLPGAKTMRSVRSVALSDLTIEELRKQLLLIKKDKFRAGPAYTDSDLVICTRTGNAVTHSHLTQWFNKLVKSTELPVIRFHDLRHTHATLLLQAGVNPKVVSERLGHTSITITLNTYSHVVPHMQDEAAQKFEQMILKQVK